MLSLSALLLEEGGGSRWIIPGAVAAAIGLMLIVTAIRQALAKGNKGDRDDAPRPMSSTTFWGLIEGAKAEAGPDPMHRTAALLRSLKALEPEEIAKFHSRYADERDDAATDGLRSAAHLMHGGCSEVAFLHFRDWVISEGENVFDAARKNADSLADLGKQELFVLEPFGYAAKRAYKSKAAKQLPGLGDEPAKTTRDPEWDEAAVRAALPRLAQLY